MNLVDTSGWFEYFTDSPYALFFSEAIENTESLIVSPLNYYEIYKRVLREFGHDEANRAIGFLNHARVVDLSIPISLEAAELSVKYQLPMADSLLLATAFSQNADFWTMDSHFKDVPSVRYFEKK
ncbi:type II toxin-antitoxin system VapC family toxin [Leptolinea tardivitalis]|uniref:PIN domain-containing protein n=1 Tax=Leptolinea tardivitalis TaxID=229920 RepID=A0A0P6WYN1_9CHLR|nr:type II toxin-antitoxin system VapC family toxin [Leptolinea tardivitalis]KPL73715.1 hypothetical protein ADM99_02510 [Leptolinea tardivitalis]GAP22813.1 predicted nucleic acid-binding protein, containing PIN domain [Leptolinea tardivitalis]